MRFLLIAVLVAGCATTENYEKMLASWIGASEDQLVSVWGPPDRVYNTDSSKYLTFARSAQGYVPGTAPSYQSQIIGNQVFTQQVGGSPGFAFTRQCITTFTITNERVSSWRWEGNACKSKPKD